MARILGRLSVRVLIGGLVGIMGLALSLLCAVNLVSAWQRYDGSQRVAELSVANKALFVAMQNFRFERGDSNSALSLDGNESRALKQHVDQMRTAVDAQLAIA